MLANGKSLINTSNKLKILEEFYMLMGKVTCFHEPRLNHKVVFHHLHLVAITLDKRMLDNEDKSLLLLEACLFLVPCIAENGAGLCSGRQPTQWLFDKSRQDLIELLLTDMTESVVVKSKRPRQGPGTPGQDQASPGPAKGKRGRRPRATADADKFDKVSGRSGLCVQRAGWHVGLVGARGLGLWPGGFRGRPRPAGAGAVVVPMGHDGAWWVVVGAWPWAASGCRAESRVGQGRGRAAPSAEARRPTQPRQCLPHEGSN